MNRLKCDNDGIEAEKYWRSDVQFLSDNKDSDPLKILLLVIQRPLGFKENRLVLAIHYSNNVFSRLNSYLKKATELQNFEISLDQVVYLKAVVTGWS